MDYKDREEEMSSWNLMSPDIKKVTIYVKVYRITNKRYK